MLDRLADARGVAAVARARFAELSTALGVLCDELADQGRTIDFYALLAGLAQASLVDDGVEVDGVFLSFGAAELAARRGELVLIDRLLRWGATPRRATAFTPRGLELCAVIGEVSGVLAPWLRQCCYDVAHRNVEVTARWPAPGTIADVRRAAKRVHAAGLLAKAPAVFVVDANSPKASVSLRAHVSDDWGTRQLLRGHWLSGYARWLLSDHAARNGVPVQLISRLEVDLPRGVGRGVAEYDVLALFESGGRRRLVAIECKAGSLANIDAASVVASRDALVEAASIDRDDLRVDAICLTTGVVGRRDVAVEPRLRARLSEAGVNLVSAGDLRHYIHYLLGT